MSHSRNDASCGERVLSELPCCRQVLQEEWVQSQCFRPERLGRLLLSDPVLAAMRRELHRESPGRRVDVCDLREALARGVIRGDLYDLITQTPDGQGDRKRRRGNAVGDAETQTGAPTSPESVHEKRRQAGRKAAETRRHRTETADAATTITEEAVTEGNRDVGLSR